MKRIESACICQTLHFILKEDASHEWAVSQVKQEVEQYKRRLERSNIPHRIVEETTRPDGSIAVKVIKQYNSSPVGSYLD